MMILPKSAKRVCLKSMPDRPSQIWKRLRSSGDGDGKLEVPSLSTGVETGYGPALLAVGPGGEPRLLVPCDATQPPGDLETSAYLVVCRSSFAFHGRNQTFIDVMVTERALDQVFADLVEAILERIASGIAPERAVTGTIEQYRRLLRETRSRSVSEKQVVGLIGELVVLRDLCRHSPKAVEAWRGPWEQRHDFRRGADAIEVKSSTRTDASVVTINGLDQLLSPNEGRMLLVHVKIERAQGGDLSVGRLHDEIIAAGVPMKRMEECLNAIGCPDFLDPEWNEFAFHLQSIEGYRVDREFPSLTSRDLNAEAVKVGVEHVVYSVNLQLAQSCALSEDEFSSALRGFMA